MKKKPHKPTKARKRKTKPTVDSFNEYREKLRQIMRAGGGSLLARHKHASQTPQERVCDTEKARKAAKAVVWEKQFPTPRARSREMSRRRRLGIEREAEAKTPPKRPKR